jgi:endonuclease/exonuclease/phosphatase family metal-dependent hydrolase
MRFLLLLLLSVSAVFRGDPPPPVKVITWNLEWFPGKKPGASNEDAAAHIVEVQAALKTMKPDILVLQEVAGEDPVKEAIKDLPGFKVDIVSRFKMTSGGIDRQQIAICSRFPAKFVASEQWVRGWAGAPRGYAFASLDCPGGRLNVYGLHLKSNIGDAEVNTSKREDAVEQLLGHMKATLKESPDVGSRWLVCGDFNTDKVNPRVPSERTFPLLAEAGFHWTFEDVPKEKRITCPAKGSYPDACFDQIFVKGLGKPVAAPVTEQKGSDHLPVAVDITIQRP